MTKPILSLIQGFLGQTPPDYVAKPYVSEDKLSRSLHFNSCATQSSMLLSKPFELELGYTQSMMGFLLFNAVPKHILIVGLGGGSLSKYCYHQFQQAQITTVEINPEVIALRDEFLIPRDDERFRVVHADASDYLATNGIQADIILLDGYDATGLPDCLCSESFYANCWRVLASHGVLVANLWSSEQSYEVYFNRLRGLFDNRMWSSKTHTSSNMIAFAIKSENYSPHWPKLKSKAQTLDERYRLNLSWVVKNMYSASLAGMENF
jgi:spermidine synthase